MNKNIIIISINRKMPIKILTSNNRIIIKENFAPNFIPLSALMKIHFFLVPPPIELQCAGRAPDKAGYFPKLT